MLTYCLETSETAARKGRADQAEAERRHQEIMTLLMDAITAMTPVMERNGHTPLLSLFLALSLLLVVAGDVETNPGPISGED